MKPVFISYRRAWVRETQALAGACRFRGLPVFHDVVNQSRLAGAGQHDRLRATIESESSGMLLYVTRDIAESPTIWSLEVPTALTRMDQFQEFPIVPIFRDIRPSSVRTDLQPHGQRIAALGGVIAVSTDNLTDNEIEEYLRARHREAANIMLDLLLGLRRSSIPIDTVRLGLMTREVGLGLDDADLILDWRQGYPNDVPAEEVCSHIHAAALDTSAALARTGYRALEIVGQAHISAAIILGAVFGSSAGYSLKVSQYDDVWSSKGTIGEFPLDISASQLDPATPDIFLVVAISRPEVLRSAEMAIRSLGLTFGGRLVIMPQSGPSREALTSGEDARTAVGSIVQALMDARADWGAGPVHLFVSAPFAFAVLLGNHLNAFGPIHIYEYQKGADTYHKAFVIP